MYLALVQLACLFVLGFDRGKDDVRHCSSPLVSNTFSIPLHVYAEPRMNSPIVPSRRSAKHASFSCLFHGEIRLFVSLHIPIRTDNFSKFAMFPPPPVFAVSLM